MYRKLLLLIVCLLLLSSCSSFQFNTEDLMRPPKLTDEQIDIYSILTNLYGNNITLKYPRSGDYQSAFVMQDVDNDGENEAIVFYTIDETDETVRIEIMDRINGEWNSLYTVPGMGDSVESIAFANISSAASKQIIVGWQSLTRTEYTIAIYEFTESQLITQYSANYDYMFINDFTQDGLDDVILLSTARRSLANLVYYDGNEVVKSPDYSLENVYSDFVQVKLSDCGNGQKAIFIDGYGEDNFLYTEVIGYYENNLQNLLATTGVNYSLQTRRAANIVCKDIDNDAILEVPFNTILYGYQETAEGEKFYLTDYCKIINETPASICQGVAHTTAGYFVKFPARWVGQVTVHLSADNKELRFFEINQEEDSIGNELLRIQIRSQSDSTDSLTTEQSIFLQKRGLFEYYGYLSAANQALSITEEELQEMFILI